MMTSEEIIIGDNLKGATENLYPHDNEDMFLAVKKATKIPHYLYLPLVFSSELWGSFAGTVGLGTLAWGIVRSKYYRSLSGKLVNIVRMTTGGSLPRTASSVSERTFLSSWLIFSLVMTTAFTSHLTSVLLQERHEPEIDTLQQLQDSGQIIVAYQTQIIELRKAFSGTSKSDLFDRMQPIPKEYDQTDYRKNKDYRYLVWEVAQTNTIIIPRSKAEIVMLVPGLGNVIHLVKESPLPNYLSFTVPAGSPMLDVLDDFVKKMKEGGILALWRREYMFRLTVQGALKPKEWFREVGSTKELSLEHLQGAFVVLALGFGASVVAFVFEVLVCKYRNGRVLREGNVRKAQLRARSDQ